MHVRQESYKQVIEAQNKKKEALKAKRTKQNNVVQPK